jgi:hypothetical protein
VGQLMSTPFLLGEDAAPTIARPSFLGKR